jgi:radical SAM protein with 4Fe4S-binding SPASM domain
MQRSDVSDFFRRLIGSPVSMPQGSTMPEKAFIDYNRGRSQKHKSAFCGAPFTNMLFAQDGSVRVCCHNTEYILGRYPQQSVDEIWNGEKFKELRKAMQQYNLSKGCEVCQRDVDMEAFDQLPARHFDSLPDDKPFPVMMEFLLSNTCNLECVMCQGEFSSLIRKNREKLPPLQIPYDKDFIEQLKPYLLHLTEARFSGSGEAFAIDLYYEIWEELIRSNPACKIMIQTNGTYMNGRIKDVLERGNFEIGVSLDSLQKETYEAIRLNASFDRVIENVHYFSKYSRERGKKFLISPCIMRDNYHEMAAFVEFATGIDAEILFHKVYRPEHFSLTTLPASKLREIHQDLQGREFSLQGKTANKNIRHYKYFTSVIGNWAEAAILREGEPVENIPLLVYTRRLEQALSTSDKFSVEEIAAFRSKFGKVLESYEGEERKKRLYARALEIPIEQLVPVILKYPEEYLIATAGNIFKI